MKDPMTIVFLGTSEFAAPSVRALASDPSFQILAVITQPDRPAGRSMTLKPPPVKNTALDLGLKVLQPEKMNTDFSDIASKIPRPDFLIVVSYGQILSDEVLAWPTKAAVNVHASLLPKLRGASPLQHAILQAFPTSGVTVQRMVRELDAGPILLQESVNLEPRETFSTLHDRLAIIGAASLLKTLNNPLQEIVQDATKATFCGKIAKTDGIADPEKKTAEEIDRMVRGLTPWPGLSIRGHKILETSLETLPGTLTVKCAHETILTVLRIHPPGGKPMSGADFLRGNSSL